MEQIPQKIHQLREGISMRPITVCIRNIWDIRKHQTDSTQICTGFLCYDHNVSHNKIWFKLLTIYYIGWSQQNLFTLRDNYWKVG